MLKFIPIFLISFISAITTEDVYNDSWALIIGINDYNNVRKLNYAAEDAEAMHDMLINTFNFPEKNITTLINKNATKEKIIKEFSNIVMRAQEKDRVLVFFAGHGETMDLPEGGQMGYLIPVNGDVKNLYFSSIPMDELKRLAIMSKAKHMLYLVDACYGGIAAVGSRGLSIDTPNYLNKIVKDKARQIITAGGKGEQVIEKSEWGHSAFTLNIKRGLQEGRADYNSDGIITANELGMFLSEKVTIDSENQQTPQFGRMTSQEGEFIFSITPPENIMEDDKESELVIATTESGTANLKEIEEKLDQLLSSQQKVEPIRINKSESWYYYLNMGYPNYSYPEKLTNHFNDNDDIISERERYNIGLIGIYFHLGKKRIIGANYEYSIDNITYDIESQESSQKDKKINLQHHFVCLSMLSFTDEFGNGPYYSIALGLSELIYSRDYTFAATEANDTVSKIGLGSKLGIGYAYSLGGSRILASVNIYYNFIDLSESHEPVLEDFTSYKIFKFNLGLLL